jgi:hypothetical protein
MKLLRAVLATVLITIQAVFEVVIVGAVVTEADTTRWRPRALTRSLVARGSG